MKTITTTWLLVFLFGTLLIAGCASSSKEISRIQALEIEKISPDETTIYAVKILREGSKVVVRGKLKRRLYNRGPILGHIDVKVVGTTGTIVEEQRAKHHKRSFKARHTDFVFELKSEPPMGSIIRITHHNATECCPLHR